MGRLHCTQDPVPEAVRGDMQQLNQLGAQQFSALTEVLFHFLTEPKEVERFLAQLSEFATTNQISLGPLKSIMKSLLLVPNGALKKGLTAEQVRTDLLTLGLSEEKATYFSEKWKQNAPTLAQWAIGQTLMINQLIDMEWRFGVTSGSSELEKVGSIFLQVSLWSVATGEGSTWLKVIQSQAWWHRFVTPHNQEVRTSEVQGQFGLHEALPQIVFY
ncbi:COMM domain-containing protein 7 isoform X1 [Rattus norvegicus]|uniref:COMM domain-containing protein 7 isoform X1 n=1 Tax=Rattus norvegicus TaxID=10116 RepID=UPI0003D076F0|eukprot:XP_006235371.1 PREDICTED: COMM domain-containing protein 7 isoform X1 [Rattus norvegicus]